MIEKSKAWRCERYLKWVRSLPCCMSGEEGCQAHHVIGLNWGLSGWGMKAPDSFVMPLSPYAHGMVHKHAEWQWWQIEWLKQTIRQGLAVFANDAEVYEQLSHALAFIAAKEAA